MIRHRIIYSTNLIKAFSFLVGISTIIIFFIFECNIQAKPSPPIVETPSPKTPISGGQNTGTPIITVGPYPRGWVPGTETWIPPLPQGMDKPRPLTEDEWNSVVAIALTDPEVIKQVSNDNIKDRVRWWVGYAGGPGLYNDSDSAIIGGTDSAVMSGKARLPTIENWYYPGIRFEYRSMTDRNSNAQLVAVDLTTNRIVLSSPRGIPPPSKPRPPG